MIFWILPALAYFIGSISFAWISGRIKGVDLRQHGSGNLGATNAGRVLGKHWFFLVFSADVAKGLLPVLAAVHLPARLEIAVPGQAYLGIATAVGAVLGHVFTCFHGFKGGKAVATSLGVLIALLPLVAAAGFGVWLVVYLIALSVFKQGGSGSVGPASVFAAIAAPALHVVFSPDPWNTDLPRTVFITALALLVIIKHRSNIAKMLGKAKPPA